MTTDRIKEIRKKTAYPNSKSVQQALLQVWNECQQDMAKDIEYWKGEFEHWHKQAMDMADKYNELKNK